MESRNISTVESPRVADCLHMEGKKKGRIKIDFPFRYHVGGNPTDLEQQGVCQIIIHRSVNKEAFPISSLYARHRARAVNMKPSKTNIL